jgi:translation elongation factor P/translation initiation factor 5A
MDWSLLLLLACPLMMLFCMKGMFTGNKDSKTSSTQSNASQHEIQQMQIQMADLMEQNQKLMKEMQSVKGTSSNVVELNDQQKRALS